MSLDETAAFIQVVDHGGFAAAGRATQVPRSTLSRQVQRLEERIGVRLMQRTTRQLGLTEAGKHYYEQCRNAVESIALAAKSAADRSDLPRGTLRVASVNLSTVQWMMDGITAFREQYPDIELVFDFADRRADLIDGGFDVAIRGGRTDDSSLVGRRLFASSLILVASPDYLAERGTPTSIEGLREHDGVLLGPRPSPFRLEGPDEPVELHLGKSVVANDLAFVCGLAVRGCGVALVENGLAAPYLADGRLVRILPEYGIHTGGGLYVLYPSRLHVPAKVRAFVDFLVAHCEENNPLRALEAVQQ